MRVAESFNQNRNIAQLAKNSKKSKAPAYYSNDFPRWTFGKYTDQKCKVMPDLLFNPLGFEFLHSPRRTFGKNGNCSLTDPQ